MPVKKEVPAIVVSRLPIYLRALEHLAAEGKSITASQELADRLGSTSAQIRKDLSYFGEFGKQGTGYEIKYLADQLKRILNVDRDWPFVLVGAGDLGHALAHYGRFGLSGFRIAAVFDNDPEKIGQKMAGLPIMDSAELKAYVRQEGIRVAIMAVSVAGAQEVADILVQGGVGAILNYVPITLSVPEGVAVQNVDPVAHLRAMTYYLEPQA
jgi:redox-sensing transcriptional repressor